MSIKKRNNIEKRIDIEKRNELVTQNIALVNYIIRKYIWIGEDEYEDLFQEGCLALVLAAERFDETKGYAFSTFAGNYILNILRRYKNEKSVIYHGTKIPRTCYGTEIMTNFLSVSFDATFFNSTDDEVCYRDFLEWDVSKNQDSFYTIVENRELLRVISAYVGNHMNKTYKAVYTYMVDYCMKYGSVPNNQEIANQFKVSRQAAYQLKRRLIQKINNFIEL